MKLSEKILLYALIILALAVTPSKLLLIFVIWACLLLFIGHLLIRRNSKALNEVSCTLFGDRHYRDNLSKESEAYKILSELKEGGDIYEGMSLADLNDLLKNRYNDNYYDLFYLHFGKIDTNPDRFKKKNKVTIMNYKGFPRPVLMFLIKKEKIVNIKEGADDDCSWLWGGY